MVAYMTQVCKPQAMVDYRLLLVPYLQYSFVAGLVFFVFLLEQVTGAATSCVFLSLYRFARCLVDLDSAPDSMCN